MENANGKIYNEELRGHATIEKEEKTDFGKLKEVAEEKVNAANDSKVRSIIEGKSKFQLRRQATTEEQLKEELKQMPGTLTFESQDLTELCCPVILLSTPY